MTPQHPSSRTTIFLDQPPSCLQFCPSSPNNFVIGTYLLSSETKQRPETEDNDASSDDEPSETIHQTKTGSLQLWNLEPETDALTQLSRYALPHAVFDLQFHPRIPDLLGIATSAGTVSLFTVSARDEEAGFAHLATYRVHEDPSIPALFLAWLPEGWLPCSGRDGFAATFSDGRTGVFGVDSAAAVDHGPDSNAGKNDESHEVAELTSFNAKQPIEIWFAAAAVFPHNQGLDNPQKVASTPYLFTGDDFGALQTISFPDIDPSPDTETDPDQDTIPAPLLKTTDKALHHTAGVTSILPLPIPLDHAVTSGSPLLLTGSYDECLRVYHANGRGRVIAEEGLGGGVWRLQLLDTTTSASERDWIFLVLASCMHGGTRVVRVVISAGEEVTAEIEVLAEFTEHESMNYASGVWGLDTRVRGAEEGSELKVVSSSFYDKRVCVWTVKV
ncbi:hypothetical protein BJX63DRAFT_160346 [Aspergillus granulosus]|uniref:Uncharacterized protein n=1 Tax=Aspergillus granulosus TaxID=176169 RepID=A0ABR4HJ46_9EURO